MSALGDLGLIMLAEFGFIVMLALIVDWLSSKFFFTWVRVRMKRHRLMLVRVWKLHTTYYRAGKLDGDILRYKDAEKNLRTVEVSPEAIYWSYGVYNVEVDEVKNGVRETAVGVKDRWRSVQGFDSVHFGNLLKRAIEAGRPIDSRARLVFFAILVILAVVAWLAWQQYHIAQDVASLVARNVGGVV